MPEHIPTTLGNWRPIRVERSASSVIGGIFFARIQTLSANDSFLANTKVGECHVIDRYWVVQRRANGWYVDDVADPNGDVDALRDPVLQ